MSTPTLSIVIPAYNEERRLASTLSCIFGYLSHQPYSYEVIVSDDGSSDGTLAVVESFMTSHPELRAVANPHRGKGCTVRSGILAATGDIVLFSDADLSTPIGELANILPWFEHGCEVVIGSRQGEGARRIGEPLFRHIMGRAFNHLVQWIAISGIQDTQCGFKAFSARAANQIFRSTLLYGDNAPTVTNAMVTGFDVEVLFLANRFGYKIREVPVQWNYDGDSRVNALRDSWRNLRDILQVRFNSLMGRYGDAGPLDSLASQDACESALARSTP